MRRRWFSSAPTLPAPHFGGGPFAVKGEIGMEIPGLTVTKDHYCLRGRERVFYKAHMGEVKAGGYTQKEARDKCLTGVLEAVSGDYTPVVVQYRGHLGVAWREPNQGWQHRVTRCGGAAFNESCSHFYNPDSTTPRVYLDQLMRNHIAQDVFICDRCQCDGVDTGAPVILDKDDQADHLAWVRWQLGVKVGKRETHGLNERQARAWGDYVRSLYPLKQCCHLEGCELFTPTQDLIGATDDLLESYGLSMHP